MAAAAADCRYRPLRSTMMRRKHCKRASHRCWGRDQVQKERTWLAVVLMEPTFQMEEMARGQDRNDQRLTDFPKIFLGNWTLTFYCAASN